MTSAGVQTVYRILSMLINTFFSKIDRIPFIIFCIVLLLSVMCIEVVIELFEIQTLYRVKSLRENLDESDWWKFNSVHKLHYAFSDVHLEKSCKYTYRHCVFEQYKYIKYLKSNAFSKNFIKIIRYPSKIFLESSVNYNTLKIYCKNIFL